jgi:hypothetical protein
MIAVSIAATIGILAYAWFLLNPNNRGDLLPWAMVMVAETILIFHALMAMWAILAGQKDPRTFAFHDAQRTLYDPEVNEQLGVTYDPTQWPLHLDGELVTADILITVYGEPIDVIRRTAEAAKAVRGAHNTYILDDGKSDAVRDMAAGLQIGGLIAFAIITETVFQWPGMGLLFIQAVQFADIPVMAAYLCLIALIFVIINLVVDLLYFAVDPRLRVERSAGAH